MKGVIISAFDTYFDRVRLLDDYYASKGHSVTIVASTYSHRLKSNVTFEGMLQIPVKTYKKNLSIARLRSHVRFAKDVKAVMERMQPDFIHVLIPPNSLVKQMSRYKETHPNVKLIFDVNDLWPETMPISKFEWLPPFRMWKQLRNRYLQTADQVYTECDLFKDVLTKQNRISMDTLYWAKEERPIHMDLDIRDDEVHFCYLGSINHIIDIRCICELLGACQKIKPTVLHIIGKGESKDQLIQEVEKCRVTVIDHGSLFDQREKQAVFSRCHYALNVMKTSVVVGLSMKSLDYMCGQIPMINTLGGDTKKLCETRNIGWHVTESNRKEIAKKICNEPADVQLERRKEIEKVYLERFTRDSFFHTLDQISIV